MAPNLRALLELSLHARFLLGDEGLRTRRALQFEFAGLHSRLALINELPSHEESSSVGDVRARETAALNERISSSTFDEVRPEWDRRTAAGRRVDWYSLFNGPNNLRELAVKLGAGDEYWHYKRFSKTTHAVDLCDSYDRSGDELYFGPILGFRETTVAAGLAISMTLHTLSSYFTSIAFSRLSSFCDMYIGIRARYLTLNGQVPGHLPSLADIDEDIQ